MDNSDRISQLEGAVRELQTRLSAFAAWTTGVNARLADSDKIVQLQAENAELRNKLGEARQQFANEQSRRLLLEQELETAKKEQAAIQKDKNHFYVVLERVWWNFQALAQGKPRLGAEEFEIFFALRSLSGPLGDGAMAWSDANKPCCIPSVQKAWGKYQKETGGRSPSQPDAI